MAFGRGLRARALPPGRVRLLPTRTVAVRLLPRVRPRHRTLEPVRHQAGYLLPLPRHGHLQTRLPDLSDWSGGDDQRESQSSLRTPGVSRPAALWRPPAVGLPDD